MKTNPSHLNLSRQSPFPLLVALIVVATALAAQDVPSVTVNWNKKTPNHSIPTLQAVVNPMLRRGSPIHDGAFDALRRLGCDYVRYAFWLPYPKLAVAELRPPDATQTYWDFSLLDPLVEDFYNASNGHPAVWMFSTIPQWMFTTPKPVAYPDDPNQVVWDYTQGTELRDLKALGDYYARVVSWYTQGGFTDELGKFHSSGHHYDIRYWEIFNEIDFEHQTTPEQYVERYDAIVEAVRKVAPQMKFVGLALAAPEHGVRMFEYFLDPKNHRRGIPLDYISFHIYAVPTADQTVEHWQHTFFFRANEFINETRYILNIRDRLSPATKIMVNEAGSILPTDSVKDDPAGAAKTIPAAYWNLSGAEYAYLYTQLANIGVDVIGESQLVGYPTQFPSVSMVNWETGKPNARYAVLDLLKNNIGPGDEFADTDIGHGAPGEADAISAQGFLRGGQRRLLLINERNREITMEVPQEFAGGTVQGVGGNSAELVKGSVDATKLKLMPFSVSIVTAK